MEEDIFKVSKDKARAKDLHTIANERLNDIIKVLPRDKPFKIMEEYYEIILELLTSLMYIDGYKTLSHISVINYAVNNKYITDNNARMIDTLRKFRHGIVYYGKKINSDFLVNNEDEIISIIKSLNKLVKGKLVE